MDIQPVDLKNAATIQHKERDAHMGLRPDRWPPPSLVKDEKAWRWTPESFPDPYRVIRVPKMGDSEAGEVLESVALFPSAPIFSLGRPPLYQQSLPRTNFHTLRVLRRWSDTVTPAPVERIYLIHNGLNECDTFSTYYKLAHLLFSHEERRRPDGASRTVCIIRPLPGHLTRYPVKGEFADKPMDRYLTDSTELFRQYLRYMLETQWLLSILVPYSDYALRVGLPLLSTSEDPELSRLNAAVLANEMFNQWRNLYDASAETLREHGITSDSSGPYFGDTIPDKNSLLRSICSLRCAAGWEPTLRPDLDNGPRPSIHAIGYSLGGFTAQSAFFTWPFAFSSCTMLNSGGALGDIQLSGFAYPEEWQRVLHATRYGIDSALSGGALNYRRSTKTIAGIKARYFEVFLRSFYEVFLQDFQHEYRARLAEYARRLLFVVGGNDPVVTPQSVLQRSPQSGINMIEVANLTHALHDDDRDWQEFWLPDVVGRLIWEFSCRAELRQREVLRESWMTADQCKMDEDEAPRQLEASVYGLGTRSPVRRAAGGDRTLIDEPLSSAEMHGELNEIIIKLWENKGWVMIARNHLPEEFLDSRFLDDIGVAMHHEESQVRMWENGRLTRRRVLVARCARVFLVIPNMLEREAGREPELFPVYHTAARLTARSPRGFKQTLNEGLRNWCSREHGEYRVFDANDSSLKQEALRQPMQALEDRIRNRLGLGAQIQIPVNTLPDSWVYVDNSVVKLSNEGAGSNVAWQTRPEFLGELIARAGDVAHLRRDQDFHTGKGRGFAQHIEQGDIRILKVSRGEFNARFRGVRVYRPREAARLLCHTALVIGRSTAYSIGPAEEQPSM